MTADEVKKPPPPPERSFAELLANPPSATGFLVKDFVRQRRGPPPHYAVIGYEIAPPRVELHCADHKCDGLRFFESVDGSQTALPANESEVRFFLVYRCSNCKRTTKEFALKANWLPRSSPDKNCTVRKFGEMPGFGPPTSAKLMKVLGEHRETFLKGRRCEGQSLGIGAFAYYRRVVEQQKNDMIDAIVKVAERIGASQELFDDLANARKETQFTKAVESIKHALPQSLLVNGQNPLLLLHRALSDGLHTQTDENCLDSAIAIRLVMAEFSERLTVALQDHNELNAALARLAERRAGENPGSDSEATGDSQRSE